MKKILTIIGFSLLIPVGVLGAVWQYGSYQERAMMAAECGIFNYHGTAQQNSSPEVIECFKRLSGKNDLLGFSVVTRYRTNLSTSITGSQSTIPVSSMTSFDGTTLTMGLLGSKVFLSLEPGSAREEIVMCTGISGNTWTGCTRGLAFTGTSTTAVSANQKSHNAGSVVVMSNVHYVYDELVDKESGDVLTNFLYYNASTSANLISATGTALVSRAYVDNRNGYWEGAVANFASLPTGVTNGETRVTLDDSKVYVWNGSAWILAGSGGGAGTIYRDDIVVTSTNRTYSLSSGSYPDKKYLTVFLNGQLLAEGASADYQASTTGNSITLNFDPVVGEVVTLRVESIDFYNAAWTSVNDDLLPDVNNSHDIGSSSLKFKDLYLAGNASAGGNGTYGGTLGVTGTTTLATTSISNLVLNSSIYFYNISAATTTNPIISMLTERTKAEDTNYTIIKSAIVRNPGVVNTSFDLDGGALSYTGYARIYVNGSAVGTERSVVGDASGGVYTTFTENITLTEPNSIIQLYYKTASTGGGGNSSVKVKNFKIFFTEVQTSTPDIIILD